MLLGAAKKKRKKKKRLKINKLNLFEDSETVWKQLMHFLPGNILPTCIQISS